MLSWRNPTAEQSDWDLDTYARPVSAAIDTVRDITGSPDVNLIGFCAGGIIATMLLSHLAATGDHRVHSMSYAVTLLDFGLRAPITAFSGPGLIAFAGRRSRRKGIITSRQMGSAFTWLRPDDLVFNYWVNNYLMGDKPPAFDILAWNADGTNLPGALHGQFLDIFRDNLLTRPGQARRTGNPGEPAEHHRAGLRHRSGRGSPDPVEGLLPDHATAWRAVDVRAQLFRAHRQPGEPAGQPQGALLDRRHRPAKTPSSGWPAPRNSWAAGGSHGPSGQRHVPATASPEPDTLAASDTR